PFDERGNSNLKPEKSRSINASMGGSLERAALQLHWEIIGFARDIRNLIDLVDFDPVTEQDLFGNLPGTVKVRGGQAVVQAAAAPGWSANLSYTVSRSRMDGGEQTNRVPEQLGKVSVDYHPPALPFGATLAMTYTGKVFNNIGPTRVQYGQYAVIDLSGR